MPNKDTLDPVSAIHYAGIPITIADRLNPSIGDTVPGVNQLTSILGSEAIAAASVVAVESLAGRLRARGRETTANMLSRSKRIIAWAGSLTYQLAAESGAVSALGVADRKDFIIGMAGTIPGIFMGEIISRDLQQTQAPDLAAHKLQEPPPRR